MGRRLAGTVAVYNPSTFTTEVFREGDTVPAWAEPRITNPALWVGDESTGGQGEAEEPPRAGKGSGREAWVTYAETVGIEHDEDATRDEIIAAIDASKS